MKICPKCNRQCDDNTAYCPECGTLLPQQQYNNSQQYNDFQQYSNSQQYNNGGGYGQPGCYSASRFGITPRSIPLCIIFTLITCGIYGIYWMIKLNDEVNIVSGEPQATSGGIVFLLTIVTCGIYGLYWLYKMGERCDRIKGVNGSSGILYLILGLVGFSIISYCLIQDTLNKAA